MSVASGVGGLVLLVRRTGEWNGRDVIVKRFRASATEKERGNGRHDLVANRSDHGFRVVSKVKSRLN